MKRHLRSIAALLAIIPALPSLAWADWSFAVSGDSRNCGDVVMPAIAADARAHDAAFYWHLGDLRAMYKPDEDYQAAARYASLSPPPSINDYLFTAWDDFRAHQVLPFGDMPFYLGIGNHEIIPPRTRNQFVIEFRDLLDRPELKERRSADAALLHSDKLLAPRTYYRWSAHGVEFINLDNATENAFDAAQLKWFDAVVDADLKDPAVTTFVVGMHEALPYSKSEGHSMCESESGRSSGLHVYAKLLEAQRRHKHVYILASHAHYYLADVFDTPHWNGRRRANVLPGWIVGTAGAERYPLPPQTPQGAAAREHTYGYLLATVAESGVVTFAFEEMDEPRLQAARSADYAPEFIAKCVRENSAIERLQSKPFPTGQCDASAPH